MDSRTAQRIVWPACFVLVFVSAFFLSGTAPPPLELDPSWHVALEYATAQRLQFGTQIAFTFGPLGFLSTRTSLGRLVPARVAFAWFWSAIVALAALGLAKRLSGWVRYAFLAWLVLFTLSEGLDQAAFVVMAYGTLLLLEDPPRERWREVVFVLALVALSLIKLSFLTASLASLTLVMVCWIVQGKRRETISLILAAAGSFLVFWIALGQSPAHLPAWFRHGLELQSGYSAAMNLLPRTPVLCAALAALALFTVVWIAALARTGGDVVGWAGLLTVAQYVFVAWKEGFTRSGDWHAFVFLWFLPLAVACCSFRSPSAAFPSLRRWWLDAAFAGSMMLCLVAAHYQIPGFAWRQAVDWPRRATHNAGTILTTLEGRAATLYAHARHTRQDSMLALDRAKDLVGNRPVDVMNYLQLAAVVNGMNYRPRPVIQGFVAYTPALQDLNEQYFRGSARPRFVLLSEQATDGRFPALEDSAAWNYVLNNYLPVAQDGRFLVLQQRTAEKVALQLVHEQVLRFGEKLDLRRWANRPLLMSLGIHPTLWGRAATLVYQPEPLYMRVARNQEEESYRVVPSMAERPFLISPLLANNYDVLKLDASLPGKEVESVTLERPRRGSFEFEDHFIVRLYAAPAFLCAARGVPAGRMIADAQARIFWPQPVSIESASPARITILHGTPALLVHSPSRIVLAVPQNATSLTGYFGVPSDACAGDAEACRVEISIIVEERSGKSRRVLKRVLLPSADTGDRFAFDIPVDSIRDRSITLATTPGATATGRGPWSLWSQCRFEISGSIAPGTRDKDN
jgi:hypothetical protein